MNPEQKTPRLKPAAAFSRAGAPTHIVLFLCTGNYYRSRFAEIVFNHLAPRRGLHWRAISRGLDVEGGKKWNVGPISKHTLHALGQRGIAIPDPLDMPRQIAEAELDSAALVIAINESEHRPMLDALHPKHAATATYWNVSDLDGCSAEEALERIAGLAAALVERLDATP